MIRLTYFFLILFYLILSHEVFAQSGKLVKDHPPFIWSVAECPKLEEIEKPLPSFPFKSCSPNVRHIKISENEIIDLIQYHYQFEPKVVQHEISYLVLRPTNKLLWQSGTGEYPHGALDNVKLIISGKRKFLELKFFTGGTGGFWEEYLSYDNNELSEINDSSIYDSAKVLFPQGYTSRRTSLDLRTLKGSIALATEQDSNCCPSGVLDFEFSIHGNNLKFEKGEFSKTQN